MLSLVDGPRHVVDHRKTADGLQKMIIWPTNDHTMIQFSFPFVLFIFKHRKIQAFLLLWTSKCEQKHTDKNKALAGPSSHPGPQSGSIG